LDYEEQLECVTDVWGSARAYFFFML